MSYVIRCLTGSKELWTEEFRHQKDAEFYYLHKAKLAQQYGPTATGFRFEFWQGDVLIDSFETVEASDAAEKG